MEDKIDRILLLLEDENVGLCSRVKCLEKTINGNGKPGLAEQVRDVYKYAAIISGGIAAVAIPVWDFIKHKVGW